MDYLDFDLQIDIGIGRGYPVYVVNSPGGQARQFMDFPFDEQALENQLFALQDALRHSSGTYRKILSSEEQTVQNFGRALFDALFIGDVHLCYAVSQERAFHEGKGLRLKLRILSPELASLPWEFLYDKRRDEFICLSNHTPIVRYLELPLTPQPLTVTPPLSILGIVASPKDLPKLNIEHEKYRVEKSLEMLQKDGLVKLTWLSGLTQQDLQRAMRGGPWHIFHFIGHGGFDTRTEEGLIALLDDEGNASNLFASDLVTLLADHYSLRLIVLNSCDGAKGSKSDIFSSTAATLVRRGIPSVLAMQYEITDTAAINLSRVFYESLAEGLPVDTAVAEARKAISIKQNGRNTLEWGTPVLYMRSPNGTLFDLPLKSTIIPNKGSAYNSPPMDEQVTQWIKAKASSERTRIIYEKHITKFRDALHTKGLDLDSEEEITISPLMLDFAAYSKMGKGVASTTYNQRLDIINSFYRFALKQKWRRSNPIEGVERREETRPNAAQPLDVDMVKNGLASIDRSSLQGKRDYTLLSILLTSGRMVTEVSDLRCGDIAREKNEVTLIFRRIRGGGMFKASLTPTVAKLLDEYLSEAYPNGFVANSPL